MIDHKNVPLKQFCFTCLHELPCPLGAYVKFAAGLIFICYKADFCFAAWFRFSFVAGLAFYLGSGMVLFERILRQEFTAIRDYSWTGFFLIIYTHRMQVMISAAGKASHTPVMPNRLVNSCIQRSSAMSWRIKLMKMLCLIFPMDCI